MVCFRKGCHGGYLDLNGMKLCETRTYSVCCARVCEFVCEFKIQEMYELTE